jgi:hypothetical protein
LIQKNIFLQKNIKIEIFKFCPKSWLREVHAFKRILKFEVSIIFSPTGTKGVGGL